MFKLSGSVKPDKMDWKSKNLTLAFVLAALLIFGTAIGTVSAATRPAVGSVEEVFASSGTTKPTQAKRYFPVNTPVNVMKAEAHKLTKQQVKNLIEQNVDLNWPIIHQRLGFSSKNKAYAFFIGQATRESTLDAGLETGGGSAHSYGPLQAAETAFANANPNYVPEKDVPEMTQYNFTPQNFYDPGIATYMGIRHLLHFSNQARKAGHSGVQLLRHALAGYNTGWTENQPESLLHDYSDEIGGLAGWYYYQNHLHDNAFTWTGNSNVDRNKPWRWY